MKTTTNMNLRFYLRNLCVRLWKWVKLLLLFERQRLLRVNCKVCVCVYINIYILPHRISSIPARAVCNLFAHRFAKLFTPQFSIFHSINKCLLINNICSLCKTWRIALHFSGALPYERACVCVSMIPFEYQFFFCALCGIVNVNGRFISAWDATIWYCCCCLILLHCVHFDCQLKQYQK